MNENILEVRIKQKTDTYDNWMLNDPVLLMGELAYEIDNNKFKFGNGVNHYSELPYVEKEDVIAHITVNSIEQTIVDQTVDISFRNAFVTDEKYRRATQGQMVVKDLSEGYAFVTPLSDAQLTEKVGEAQIAKEAAERAATLAGNSAAEAINAKAEIDRKFWFGTIAEYNRLPHVYQDTVYVIKNGEMPYNNG